ncbi:MAG TPA: thioredoxin family protein [Puia sp.]
MEKIMKSRNVSPESWLTARKKLLDKENELMRLRDQLLAERRELPRVRVTKEYIFDSPEGEVTLADLFGSRSQLIINHFMFGPTWEEGCPGCSLAADHIGGALIHLEHHDVSYAAVSRAPFRKIAAFKKRMGWGFNWVSSFGRDFNYDFHVSFTREELSKGEAWYNFALQKIDSEELPGMSAFFRDEDGSIFHTYSVYGRGGEELVGANMLLDLTPLGRNENGPDQDLRNWPRLHDQYLEGSIASSCCSMGKGGACH